MESFYLKDFIDTNEGEELTLVAVDRWNNSSEKSVKINVELKATKLRKVMKILQIKLMLTTIKTKLQ